MPRETGLEFKVGAFVLAAFVLLVAFVFAVSDFSVFSKGSVYKVVFSYANGLRKNAPVRMAGVDVGHVRDIRVYFDSHEARMVVEAGIWIMDGVMLPPDSHFLVNQLGLMGEKYLEILPGVSTDVVSPGAVFAGESPVPMENVIRQLSTLGKKVEITLNAVNEGILSQANRQALSETLANLALITGKINQGEGTMGRLMMDDSVFENLSEMTADLKANPWKLFYRPKGQ